MTFTSAIPTSTGRTLFSKYSLSSLDISAAATESVHAMSGSRMTQRTFIVIMIAAVGDFVAMKNSPRMHAGQTWSAVFSG